MTSTTKRLHAVISGRVQGVGFRYFVQENAYRLNLKGWVRNRRNGKVEVEVEGNQVVLEKFLQELHQGPRSAVVSAVETSWSPANGEFTDFRVQMTA